MKHIQPWTGGSKIGTVLWGGERAEVRWLPRPGEPYNGDLAVCVSGLQSFEEPCRLDQAANFAERFFVSEAEFIADTYENIEYRIVLIHKSRPAIVFEGNDWTQREWFELAESMNRPPVLAALESRAVGAVRGVEKRTPWKSKLKEQP